MRKGTPGSAQGARDTRGKLVPAHAYRASARAGCPSPSWEARAVHRSSGACWAARQSALRPQTPKWRTFHPECMPARGSRHRLLRRVRRPRRPSSSWARQAPWFESRQRALPRVLPLQSSLAVDARGLSRGGSHRTASIQVRRVSSSNSISKVNLGGASVPPTEASCTRARTGAEAAEHSDCSIDFICTVDQSPAEGLAAVDECRELSFARMANWRKSSSRGCCRDASPVTLLW
eukprot:scaffold285103_cov23-Tisochrysis_lutea.AAC.1